MNRLERLCVHPTAGDLSAYVNDFQCLGQTLRRLRIANRSNLVPIILPMIGNLTHLELFSSWGGADEPSLFKTVLGNGERIESLRLVGCPMQTHSTYFRKYPRSLPRLRDFGLHIRHGPRAVIDPDLFPSICDFLRDRPLLDLLELTAHAREIDQKMFGFDVRVWEFISSLENLHTLSANLLNAIPHQKMVELIPRSVKTLTLPPCGVWYLEQLLQKVRYLPLFSTLAEAEISQGQWPDNVRFFGYAEHIERSASTLAFAKKIATSIPSVRVVRLAHDYFSVVSREDGKPVRMDQWSTRTAQVFRREYLEKCGSEEHEYLDLDHDGIMA